MQDLITKIQALVKARPNQEICGIVGSDSEVYLIKNVASQSRTSFVFDKREYFSYLKEFKQKGTDIKYFFHSHPFGDSTPSNTDIAFAKRSGVPQIIVSFRNYTVVPIA